MKDLHIQSNQFELPQQFETLNKLCQCFKDQEFFVIGATARDMLSIALGIDLSTRTTRDLDISIAVDSWDSFMKVQELLINSGFEKDSIRKQRFYYKYFELDVVPFGKLSEDGAKIFWPPEASPEMTVRGFESVLKECVNVKVDDADIEFKIPTTAGLFVTKLDAWIDRGLEKDNDMDDMMYLVDNFYLPNCTEPVYTEVFEAVEDSDMFISGAYMLAMDASLLLSDEEKAYYKDKIETELTKQEASLLIQKSMKSSKKDYDTVYRAWELFVKRLVK